MITRTSAISAIRLTVASELEALESLAGDARDEATSSETKAEGKYDTRATEASYLARGQAERVASMRTLAAWFKRLPPDLVSDTVSLGALVALEGERVDVLFVAPSGGERVTVDGVEVKTISLAAPLGAAMMGLEEGDEFEVRSPGGQVAYEVVRLA